jgi:hypothetical protein
MADEKGPIPDVRAAKLESLRKSRRAIPDGMAVIPMVGRWLQYDLRNCDEADEIDGF